VENIKWRTFEAHCEWKGTHRSQRNSAPNDLAGIKSISHVKWQKLQTITERGCVSGFASKLCQSVRTTHGIQVRGQNWRGGEAVGILGGGGTFLSSTSSSCESLLAAAGANTNLLLLWRAPGVGWEDIRIISTVCTVKNDLAL